MTPFMYLCHTDPVHKTHNGCRSTRRTAAEILISFQHDALTSGGIIIIITILLINLIPLLKNELQTQKEQ